MKTHTETNAKIAKFMNTTPLNWGSSQMDINYHNSWNMLMPVVLSIENDYYLQFEIKGNNCQIYWMGAEPDNPALLKILEKFNGVDTDALTKIEATYNAVVEFIGYLNSQKP